MNKPLRNFLSGVFVLACMGCTVQRHYTLDNDRLIKEKYLHKTVALTHETTVREWAAGIGGDYYESLYEDGKVTDYVSLAYGTLRDYLTKGDLRIGRFKFYHIRRLPRRVYGLGEADDTSRIRTMRLDEPYSNRNIGLGPYRMYRVPEGTKVYIKKLYKSTYSPPDTFFAYWGINEVAYVELFVAELNKKIVAQCSVDGLVDLVGR